MCHNYLHSPTFCTRIILTFDIFTAPYTVITSSLFSLFNSTCILVDKDTGIASPFSFLLRRYNTVFRTGIPIAVIFAILVLRLLLLFIGTNTARGHFEASL